MAPAKQEPIKISSAPKNVVYRLLSTRDFTRKRPHTKKRLNQWKWTKKWNRKDSFLKKRKSRKCMWKQRKSGKESSEESVHNPIMLTWDHIRLDLAHFLSHQRCEWPFSMQTKQVSLRWIAYHRCRFLAFKQMYIIRLTSRMCLLMSSSNKSTLTWGVCYLRSSKKSPLRESFLLDKTQIFKFPANLFFANFCLKI